MKINPKTRRQFLTGTGKIMLALPFLPSMWPRAAWGQTVPKDMRFIFGYMPHGGYSNTDLMPTYAPDILTDLGGQTIRHTNLRLSPVLGSISTIYSAALNPFLSKLNVLQGLDAPITFTHGESTMLGHCRYLRGIPTDQVANKGDLPGYPMVPSIDQFLAYSPYFYKTTPVIRSVVGYNNNSVAQITPNDPNSFLKEVSGPSTPLALFNALFGVSTPPTGNNPPTPDQLNSKTVIDHVLGDLNATLKHRNISSTDKARLDEFTTQLFETQKRLTASGGACTAPANPVLNSQMNSLPDDLQRENFLDLYTSVLAAGIKCGRTRIANLQGPMQIATQGKYTNDTLHSWGHNGMTTEIAGAYRWMIEKLYVPLLAKLDVDEDGSSTYLDNSLVAFSNRNSPGYHKNWDRPIIMAGSAGGFLKTGYFCDYRQIGVKTRYGTPGILYSQFLITVLRAMGIPANDPMLAQYAYAELVAPTDAANSFWNTLITGTTIHPHQVCLSRAGNLLPIITG